MIEKHALRCSVVRFAPSPTGQFHVGNLRTAWIASELAKSYCKELFIRFEDIDRARSFEHFRLAQLRDLTEIGIPSSLASMQSQSLSLHRDWFEKMRAARRIYPCSCSRSQVKKDLQALGQGSAPSVYSFQSASHDNLRFVYSGRCRPATVENALCLEKQADSDSRSDSSLVNWRWIMESNPSGHFDPIVARSELSGKAFEPGYHLACAVDDALLGSPLIVRAWDLESAEAVQSAIREFVSSSSRAEILHTALVCDRDGHRLEKRTQGVTLEQLKALGVATRTVIQWFERSVDIQKLQPPGESVRRLLFRVDRGFDLT